MNSRERVILAINHKEPDRVPVWFGSVAAGFIEKTYENVANYLQIPFKKQLTSFFDSSKYDEKILERMHSDLRFLINGAGGNNSWKPVKTFPDGTYTDIYNIRLKKLGYFSSAMVEHPMAKLQTVKEIMDYDQWADNKVIAEKIADGLKEEGMTLKKEGKYAICGDILWSLIETTIWLRGLETWAIDIAARPEMLEALLNKLWKYQTPIYDKYLQTVGEYVDIILMGDDLGMQTCPLISPAHFKKQLQPWLKRKVDFIKERTNNAKVVMHSCGSIYALIPDIINAGVDGLQSIQPFAKDMEPEKLKSEFGNELIFVGGLDHQQVLGKDINDIKQFIDNLVKSYAPGGGFIFAATHDIPPDIPPKNILEAFDYLLEIGNYPIK